jgi:hypothetical protein
MRAEADAGLRHDDATLGDLDAVNRRVDDLERRFNEAFPGGDHIGHCRYHALMIENIEWKKRLWRALVEKSLMGLAIGTLAFVGMAVWGAIVALIKKAGG